MAPLVSIIIPCLNRSNLLGETIESVLSQTYSKWECIIVDDGSTDNTPEVARKYADSDGRIIFLNRPTESPKGAASCRNIGLEYAKGDYIQFLDSDDLLHPEKLKFQIKYLEQQDKLTIVTSKWGWFREKKYLNERFKFNLEVYRNYKRPISLLNDMGLFNVFFPPHVYLISRELLGIAGKWEEKLSNNDDAEFFTRIILNASKILFVPEAVVYYRDNNDDKLSDLNSEQKFKSAIKSWELIELHVQNKHQLNSGYYFNNAKNILYKSLITQFPDLINEYKQFFSGKKNYDGVYYRMIRKLKRSTLV